MCLEKRTKGAQIAEELHSTLEGSVVALSRNEIELDEKYFPGIGYAYLLGVLCREGKFHNMKQLTSANLITLGNKFSVKWIDSVFKKSIVADVNLAVKGIMNYTKIQQQRTTTWKALQRCPENELERSATLTESMLMQEYTPDANDVITLTDVENIKSMRFVPNAEMVAPETYSEMKTKLKDPSQFKTSPLGAFFQYLPVSFWRQVLAHTNLNKEAGLSPFSLDELFKCIGILLYMGVVRKGTSPLPFTATQC